MNMTRYSMDTTSEPHIVYRNVQDKTLHCHNYVEVVIVIAGTVDVCVENRKKTLSDGDAVIVFPHTLHGYRTTDSAAKCVVITFGVSFFPALKDIFTHSRPVRVFLSSQEIENRVENFLSSLYSASPGFEDNESIIATDKTMVEEFSSLIAEIIERCGAESCDEEEDGIFHSAMCICCENFSKGITVREIADMLSVAVSRLERIFCRHSFDGVKTYINTLRMDRAEYLLRNSDKSISDIVAESGFCSIRTFNRMFLKETGTSPGEYRRSTYLYRTSPRFTEN